MDKVLGLAGARAGSQFRNARQHSAPRVLSLLQQLVMAAACDATPELGFVVSTVGISLAGCVLALAVACRARTFGLRLTACFALSVLIGLPVWLLPIEWCTSQALLEEFSYLSSMLWAVICLLHVYLVVNTGLRVAWRFEVFCHAVSAGASRCWVDHLL